MPCVGGCTWSATWILVQRGAVDLVEGGDSGGPWMVGNTAYGITMGQWDKKGIYMAINYIDILDVTVLTE